MTLKGNIKKCKNYFSDEKIEQLKDSIDYFTGKVNEKNT
jgi:hypothetical protein